ncbi:SPOR domain-containing protein [Candidatus Fukatsuia anoeciicola]|uniref:SPOR domain-containing protein n=1 Tax=Candidatus Fukatsuia anoeciicola TaxID=2994492 RepID=UPI0034641D2D
MAQKDYVSREHLIISRSKTRRLKKVNNYSMAIITLVLVVVLLIKVITEFYFISNNKVDKLRLLPNHNIHTITKLPPLPEERWHYIKELENRQIEIAKPTEFSSNSKTHLLSSLNYNYSYQIMEPLLVTTPKLKLGKEKVQNWVLQCGSFRIIDQAKLIQAKLAFDGIESQLTSSNGWYRVLLGPYSNYTSINKIFKHLKDNKVLNCITLSIRG